MPPVTRPAVVVGLVLLGSAAMAFADPEPGVKLVTFDGAPGTTFKWQDLNDPVMGGVSSSTWNIDTTNGIAAWNGTVRIVPSLKAPGFCNAETTNWFAKFNDASAYTHLMLRVRTTTTEYTGYKVSFAADTLNPQFKSFKSEFNVTGANEWTTVTVPFKAFSNDWSSFTGRCDTQDPPPFNTTHMCCSPATPEVCPTAKNLRDISAIGLWAEGEAGDFHLDVQWVGAGNVTETDATERVDSAAAAANGVHDATGKRFVCEANMQKKLRFNVSDRLAEDYLPAGAVLGESLVTAVCCDRNFAAYAEPSHFFERPDVGMFARIDPATTTTFYDSACGIPLFTAPQNRTFDQWRMESIKYGWPSFRAGEVVSDNVKVLETGEVVSKCGTHLGSSEPDVLGPRYCTDVVCVSGYQASGLVFGA